MKIRLFTIPNIITLLNLAGGSAGVIVLFASEDPLAGLKLSFLFMVVSAILDFFDGFAARMLKSYSAIGVQLDSLADMVSFGLLPALIAFRCFGLTGGGESLWGLLTLSIVVASALRLAKFNVDETQTTEFEGLPTPANALLIGSAGYMLASNFDLKCGYDVWVPYAILGASLLLSWLLVSPVRMFSLKFTGFGWRGNELRYIFLAVAVAMLVAAGLSAVWAIMTLYIIVSAVRWMLRGRKDAGTGVIKK